MNFLFIFFTSYIITSSTMPYLINSFTKWGIVDKPDQRRINSVPIPRMGGVIIIPIVLLIVFTYYTNIDDFKIIMLSSVIILVCGLIDDIIELKWYYKFFLQSLSSLLLTISLSPFFSSVVLFGITITNPYYFPILFIFILGAINSVNLLDGMDGLVSGLSIITVLPIFLLSFVASNYLIGIISCSLIGILLALLKYNTFPAKIFLGDSGALSLGFLLTYSLLVLSMDLSQERNMDLSFPILILGIPLVDTLKVMFERIIKNQNPFLPSKDHIHHIIFGEKIRHKTTVFLIHFLNLAFVANGLMYIKYNRTFALINFLILSSLLLSIKPILHKMNKEIVVLDKMKSAGLEIISSIAVHKKKLIIVSSLLMILLIISSLRTLSFFEAQYLYFFFIGGITLLILSIFNSNTSKKLIPIYVFFNLSFFFITVSLNAETISLLRFDRYNIIDSLKIFSFILFFIMMLIVFVARDKIFIESNKLLNGLDLTLFALIITILVVREFFPWDLIDISISLFIALLGYFWYKAFSYHFPKYSPIVYYGFFLLNFIIIILSLSNV